MLKFAPAASRTLPRTEFIALIAGLMALNALAIDVMLPALPYMGADLGVAEPNDRQLVLVVYMLGFGASQLAYGPLSDRFGRRAPLLVGMLVYLLAAFSAVLAPTFAILLGLRFVQGMGAAGTRVIAQSVVRDTYGGRAMAEIMSLVFMVFMIMPIVAPGIGQVILLTAPWHFIFLFMGGLATVICLWAFLRLPETLAPENRRELRFSVIAQGFWLVCSNRVAISYAMAGVFLFGALFGFINSSQQIYVGIYGLGPYFPVAFAVIASLMSLASFLNSRVVGRIGMRRLSNYAVIAFTAISILWWAISLGGTPPLWLFMGGHAIIMFHFGWSGSNMNALSMEPLGKVAGTASAVFGFIQTVGGALLGLIIGQLFDGTVIPIAGGYAVMGLCALACILIAEKGRLFGVGEAYAD